MAEGKGHTELPWCIPAGDGNGHVICAGDDPAHPGKILFVLRPPFGTSRHLSNEEIAECGRKIVTAVNTYPAVEGLVSKVSELLLWVEPIAGDNRDDAAAANEVLTVEQVKAALSRFRSLQKGGQA